jgi:signal transduction histidine kinase
MLTQIFVAILIVMVAFMVARDLAMTKSEHFLGHLDGSGRETLPGTAGDTHGDRAGVSFREPFRTTAPTAGYNVGRHPEPIGPPAGIEPARTSSPSGQSSSAGQDMVPAANGNQHVRSRLRQLVIIPAAASAVIALCVVGLADVLQGTGINSSSSSARDEAILGAVVLGVVIVVVLVLAVRATIAIARSVLQPLYRLRARALALAAGRPSDPPPADVASPDEMGDIARALEQMGSRMSLPGQEEVGLRNKVDAMFVNLSRRNQSLVERQMRLMDNLEQGEPDKDRRATLFRVSRIAARMHRDSQNLLVLAGHVPSSTWDQPAALMNVVRAAMSEVEEYERVAVHPQPEIAVSGPAVDDVVHLLAELIQNATSFSAGEMEVEISGQLLDSGGALISITDRGGGMSAQEMAHANWRLENPPSGDIELPK